MLASLTTALGLVVPIPTLSKNVEIPPLILNEVPTTKFENLNKYTSLKIHPIKRSQIAIIGCGPVGMATGLWLRKLYPNLNISIYETRIDSIKNKIIIIFNFCTISSQTISVCI